MEAQNGLELESRSGPWMVLFCENQKRKAHQIFYSLTQRRSYVKNISHSQDNICRSTPQGWILMMHPYDEHCYLHDPISMTKIRLPRLAWDLDKDDSSCVLSHSPTDPKCTLLVGNLGARQLFFCKPGSGKWVKYEYDLDASDRLVDIATFDGGFYGCTLRSNLALIYCPPGPRIEIVENTREVEWPLMIASEAVYLVQHCEDLYLVRKIYEAWRSNKAVHITVMRRDFSSGAWDTVDSINGGVFLIGDSCCSSDLSSASELGIKGNCIYFVERNDKHLYCFDIEEGFISIQLPCSEGDICNRVTADLLVRAI